MPSNEDAYANEKPNSMGEFLGISGTKRTPYGRVGDAILSLFAIDVNDSVIFVNIFETIVPNIYRFECDTF